MRFQRALLRDVEGYVPGEQPKESGIIKLNTNENPYPPSPRVVEAISQLGPDIFRKYPDPVSLRFRALCAERYGVPGPEWVIAGNGMDEILAMALRTFVDPGDTVVAPYPTYTLYEVLCKLHGCTIEYFDLNDDFTYTDAFLNSRGRLCFLTRPNAPTSISAPRAQVEAFCEYFPGLVVIDEAYVDFADDSCIDLSLRYENVIVMRTFSKSFSLAGARIGTAVAQPQLINEFLKTKDSYNMNAFSQAAGIAAMEDYAYMEESARKVKATRERLRGELIAFGFDVPKSESNFLLARWNHEKSAKAIFHALRDQKILVRYFAQRRLEDALRITVGTDDECAALVEALRRILS